MENVIRRGAFALYYPQEPLILPQLYRPFLSRMKRTLKKRFGRIVSVQYGTRAKGRPWFFTGTISFPSLAAQLDIIGTCLENLGLRPLELQDAKYLCQFQNRYPALAMPGIERIWFCGTCVLEENPDGSSGSYYPVMVRHACKVKSGFTKWQVSWEHAFDESDDLSAYAISTDRIALAKM